MKITITPTKSFEIIPETPTEKIILQELKGNDFTLKTGTHLNGHIYTYRLTNRNDNNHRIRSIWNDLRLK